jgi:hypothetical protein
VKTGRSVLSTDTFIIRHDRAVSFSFDNLQWTITPVTTNTPPTANAGADQNVAGIGILVGLDGTMSSDPEGASLTYSWTLSRPAGSTAALSSTTSATPTFTPDKKGT